MNIIITREALLKPLTLVLGAIEKRQTMSILSHVLIKFDQNKLWMTGTDNELELVGFSALDQIISPFEITVPAKKLLEICKALPDNALITLNFEEKRIILKSGKSRFTLLTLPAEDFPKVDFGKILSSLSMPQQAFRFLLEKTCFAMAQQDVRYYLNGMLFNITADKLQVVATDGHRLAQADYTDSFSSNQPSQVIIPRKAVLELIRLLQDIDEPINIAISTNHFHVTTPDFSFASKLMEGKFPDFNRVIPKNTTKELHIDRDIFKQALNRVAILCNEKFHGIRMLLTQNKMLLSANNPEHEEAEEELEVEYDKEQLEFGFNVNYLLDVLNVLSPGNVTLLFIDASNSVLLRHQASDQTQYVVMPMRL